MDSEDALGVETSLPAYPRHRCLLVPDDMVSRWEFRAKVREYMERYAFSKSKVTRVFITADNKRVLVSVESLESLGTENRGYPEFEKVERCYTFDLEYAAWGDFTEVPA